MSRKAAAPTTYSLSDVLRLTGAKRPQIEYWVRKGIIRGEFEYGAGLPRQFVFRNLVEASIALDLSVLDVGTAGIAAVVNEVRYGDVESDVRTPWFVKMRAANHVRQPPLSPEERRERREQMREFRKRDAETPIEDRCCAEANDDGTLKLLRLLRAFIDNGASEETWRPSLLAVAREHLREVKSWHREFQALHRRWRQFKDRGTRPKGAHFWVVLQTHAPLDDGERRWRTAELTDNAKFEATGPSVLTVALRPILEQLEEATGDVWRATPEHRVFKTSESSVTPQQLVAQAEHQYELVERRKALLATTRKQAEDGPTGGADNAQ